MTTTSTQAAEPITSATEPAPCEDETQSVYAWSHTDDDDTLLIQRRSWKLPLAAAILAATGLAAAGITVWPHHSTLRNPAAPPQAAPHSSIAPAPAAAPPAPQAITTDDQFIAELASHWGPIPDRSQVIHDGLSVCSLISRGADKPTIEHDLVNKKVLDEPDAEFFVNTAAAHYCPQG